MLLLTSTYAHSDEYKRWLSDIEYKLESTRMMHLAKTKQGATINAFTSDGCSGGLSAGWQLLASALEDFKLEFGKQPPWLHCCTKHDRAYWQGSTEEGFNKRLEADKQLQQCVIETGHIMKPELQKRFHLNEQQLDGLFETIAKVMFDAVRLGGRPCTPFAWRWGYGWPHCVLTF